MGSFTEQYAEAQVLSLADSVTEVKPVVRSGVDAEEISYLRHGQHRVALLVELPHWLPDGRGTAALAAAYRPYVEGGLARFTSACWQVTARA